MCPAAGLLFFVVYGAKDMIGAMGGGEGRGGGGLLHRTSSSSFGLSFGDHIGSCKLSALKETDRHMARCMTNCEAMTAGAHI